MRIVIIDDCGGAEPPEIVRYPAGQVAIFNTEEEADNYAGQIGLDGYVLEDLDSIEPEEEG